MRAYVKCSFFSEKFHSCTNQTLITNKVTDPKNTAVLPIKPKY